MINNVVLVGRLTRKPELKHTPQGIAVATFSVAISRNYTTQSGERETDYINIVAWRRQAENIGQYLDKGSLVGIQGSIRTRNYDAQDGTRRYVTEVVADNVTFLDSRNSNNANQTNNQLNHQNQAQQFANQGNQDPFYQMEQNQFTNKNDSQQGNQQEADFLDSFDLTDDDLPF